MAAESPRINVDDVGANTTPLCFTWGFPEETIDSNSEAEILKLYKTLECPICHQFPESGTIFSCRSNRHMICENCLPSSKICPVCSSPIPDEISWSAESCVANFFIPCKYKFQGCPQIIRGRKVRKHVQNCPFRPITCIVFNCGATMPFRELLNHLWTVHENKVNGIKDTNKHTIEWWIEGDAFALARWPPFYLTCFNNAFLYMCVSNVHGTWEWMWILAGAEEAKRFRVEAKMENVEAFLSLQWRGPVHSIRKTIREIISSGEVFITNSKEIRNPFMYKKGKDKISYWRTSVTIHQVAPPTLSSVPYLKTNDPMKLEIYKPNDGWGYLIDESDDIEIQTVLKGDPENRDGKSFSEKNNRSGNRRKSSPLGIEIRNFETQTDYQHARNSGDNTEDPNWFRNRKGSNPRRIEIRNIETQTDLHQVYNYDGKTGSSNRRGSDPQRIEINSIETQTDLRQMDNSGGDSEINLPEVDYKNMSFAEITEVVNDLVSSACEQLKEYDEYCTEEPIGEGNGTSGGKNGKMDDSKSTKQSDPGSSANDTRRKSNSDDPQNGRKSVNSDADENPSNRKTGQSDDTRKSKGNVTDGRKSRKSNDPGSRKSRQSNMGEDNSVAGRKSRKSNDPSSRKSRQSNFDSSGRRSRTKSNLGHLAEDPTHSGAGGWFESRKSRKSEDSDFPPGYRKSKTNVASDEQSNDASRKSKTSEDADDFPPISSDNRKSRRFINAPPNKKSKVNIREIEDVYDDSLPVRKSKSKVNISEDVSKWEYKEEDENRKMADLKGPILQDMEPIEHSHRISGEDYYVNFDNGGDADDEEEPLLKTSPSKKITFNQHTKD